MILIVIATCIVTLTYQYLIARFMNVVGIIPSEDIQLFILSLLLLTLPPYLILQIRFLFREPIARWSNSIELKRDIRMTLSFAAMVLGAITVEPICVILFALMGQTGVLNLICPLFTQCIVFWAFNLFLIFLP